MVTTGKDILVTLPAYRFTSTPETDNTWPIEVTAEDVKGNFSNREQSMVVVRGTYAKPERFLGIVKYPDIERGFPFNRHTDFYCA
ncbi:hypothetical protein HTZ85_22370 [Escherichia coli]|nr:hypothetical protein [Escherichia coli]